MDKTLKELTNELHSMSGLSEQALSAKLSTESDYIARATFSRWRSGIIKETTHARHVRVIELHRKLTSKQKLIHTSLQK